MRLTYNPASPADRRIIVTAIEAGLEDRIEEAPAPGRSAVPVLERDDGSKVVGARAICAHLDRLHERPKLMPSRGEARLELYQLEAYADILVEAASTTRQEMLRPEAQRWSDVAHECRARTAEVLDRLEAQTGTVLVGPVTLGHIAVGCALDWLESCLPEESWRRGHPGLSDWYDRFNARPSMRATRPVPAAIRVTHS